MDHFHGFNVSLSIEKLVLNGDNLLNFLDPMNGFSIYKLNRYGPKAFRVGGDSNFYNCKVGCGKSIR
jgi:hypothetical protein